MCSCVADEEKGISIASSEFEDDDDDDDDDANGKSADINDDGAE